MDNLIDAEETLLSMLMLDPNAYNDVSQVLRPDDFSSGRTKEIFTSVRNVVNSGAIPDVVSLADDMQNRGVLDICGGSGSLLRLSCIAESAANRMHLASIVKRKAQLRAIATSYRSGLDMADQSKDPSEIISHVESLLDDGVDNSSSIKSMADSCESLADDYISMARGEIVSNTIRTHMPELDKYLGAGGVGEGEVLVIAAPTSCGKSALAINIGLNVATKDRIPVGIVSLEMPQKQIANRMVQLQSGVNIRRIKERIASDTEVARAEATAKLLSDQPIFTTHSVKNCDDLSVQVRGMVKKNGVRLLIIDYLQLIPFDGRKSKAEGISDISHRIKQMALDLNIGIVLLAQVNREGAKRDAGLSLYDLKDSGDIENDADAVILMWPKNGDIEMSRGSNNTGPYTLLNYVIAKNREGERGVRGEFYFYHKIGRFA